MSNKSKTENHGVKKMFERKTIFYSKDTQNLSSVNDISKDFDCLKISILNKASRVSGEFDKVTLGPDAIHENGNSIDTINSEITKSNNSSLNGTKSSRNNISFSIKKILLENEIQRREKVKKLVDRKKEEMEKSKRQMHEKFTELHAAINIQREKEAAQRLAQLEAEEEQIAQKQERDRKNMVQQKKLKESEEIMKRIMPYRENFHAKWKDIATISKACRDRNSAHRLITQYAVKLKELSVEMEAINEKARTGDLTTSDIKMAEVLSQCNDEVFQAFKADIENIDAAFEQELAKRELEMKQAEQAAQEEAFQKKQIEEAQNAARASLQFNATQEVQIGQQPQNIQNQATEVDSASKLSQPPPPPPQYPTTPVSAAPSLVQPEVPAAREDSENNSTKYSDTESCQMYIENMQLLTTCITSYQEFAKSDATKKLKFECQKSLNIAINAISHTSREQMTDKYEKLKTFLSGRGNPNILCNPQIEVFSKNLLAEKIVNQGDTSISSKPELAFPFAAIAVALWNDWPDFGRLLIANFYAKSPFFVPVFLTPQPGQSEEEYVRSLGWKKNDNGELEKPTEFWKRIGGVMYLYASIIITRQKKGVNKPHPHGIANAWRWLAATLNTEPRCDIAEIIATLINNMLEVTGNDLWHAYPNQFPKLLRVLNDDYCVKLKQFEGLNQAPIERLSQFLTTALKTGSIPPPKGQLPPNFW